MKAAQKRKAMAAIRRIMKRDYGEDAATVKESVWDGDPYGWSEGAVGTITSENGLATINYWDDYGIDTQFEIWRKVKAETGLSIFGEWVNAAVMAIYEN